MVECEEEKATIIPVRKHWGETQMTFNIVSCEILNTKHIIPLSDTILHRVYIVFISNLLPALHLWTRAKGKENAENLFFFQKLLPKVLHPASLWESHPFNKQQPTFPLWPPRAEWCHSHEQVGSGPEVRWPRGSRQESHPILLPCCLSRALPLTRSKVGIRLKAQSPWARMCLFKYILRLTWSAAVHEVAKRQTQLREWTPTKKIFDPYMRVGF